MHAYFIIHLHVVCCRCTDKFRGVRVSNLERVLLLLLSHVLWHACITFCMCISVIVLNRFRGLRVFMYCMCFDVFALISFVADVCYILRVL